VNTKPPPNTDFQFVDFARDPAIRDALSEVTRNERRSLLGASLLAIAISTAGLIPEKISAFGVTITPPAQNNLLLLLAAVLAYFILAFLLYGYSENRENVFLIISCCSRKCSCVARISSLAAFERKLLSTRANNSRGL
jgi:hypothetical protein